MRAPFPYENNGLLLRQILVPDPLTEGEWEALVTGWHDSGKPDSLLEWAAIRHAGGADPILRAMEGATGAGWGTWHESGKYQPDSTEEGLLERHGFVCLGKEGPHHIVAGGPDLPPDLKGYLGEAAEGYRWVMISPIRGKTVYQNAGQPVDAVAEPVAGMAGMLGELLLAAVADKASDIYFEAFDTRFMGRVRKGGRMQPLGQWSGDEGQEILRILKRWANFSTASTPLPQDGRIEIPGAGGSNAFRASHVRAENGESMVLRLTGSRSRIPSMSELGVPDDLSWELRDTVLHESGLVLITGATCSGKTTTACALLSALAGEPIKILSIEDPVEHEIPQVVQSCVKAVSGWTFERALRAFLRQDPDIIMVGEIRDRETAGMACRAALTGHSVVATLHGRSPEDAVRRLHEWDIAQGIIEDCLSLVVHQRLAEDPETGRLRPAFTCVRHRQKPAPAWPAPRP